MNEQLKPMDVYAEMDIPFALAAYFRQHRFSVEAVGLTEALKKRTHAKAALRQAEQQLEKAEEVVRIAVAAGQKKMEKSDAV